MLHELEEVTGSTPKALLDAPDIHGSVKEAAAAYEIMARRRTVGFSANPIQLSEIQSFIQLFGAPSLPIDVFVQLIGVMDSKYLALSKNGNKPTS